MDNALPNRDEKGQYPAFAWPGGYPMIYLTRDGMTVCAECASRETDQAQEAVAADIHWEGPDETCEDCGKVIPSAYGDPNADTEATR